MLEAEWPSPYHRLSRKIGKEVDPSQDFHMKIKNLSSQMLADRMHLNPYNSDMLKDSREITRMAKVDQEQRSDCPRSLPTWARPSGTKLSKINAYILKSKECKKRKHKLLNTKIR